MKMFGTNGIRGIANDYMSPELALRVGKAVASVLGPGTVAVAKDPRTSSDMLAGSVEAGLMSAGVDVDDLGMVPTPALQYYVKTHEDVVGGVMITASHNPPEFNGIKCVAEDGTECSHVQEEAIEAACEKGVKNVGWGSVGILRRVSGAGEAYVDAIVSKVDAGAIRGAGLKVCLDCSNGAASYTSPLLLSKLGVRAVTMNATPDGMFPGHESEPTEEHLKDLSRLVADTGSDLGMAHDGDADRCVFVTGKGEYVPGDKSLAILAAQAVSGSPGAKAVTTVATSKVVEAAVASAGGKTVYTAVGSPVVARRMIADGAVVGGEENGGVIFADHQYCRDGAMAIARMLEAVALKGSLEDQVASLPEFHTVKAAMRCDDSDKKAVMDGIAEMHRGERVDLTDGVRIDYDHGWVLMRPSGTEPKFRVYAESKDEEAARELSERFLREAESVRDSLGKRRRPSLLERIEGDAGLPLIVPRSEGVVPVALRVQRLEHHLAEPLPYRDLHRVVGGVVRPQGESPLEAGVDLPEGADDPPSYPGGPEP